MMGIAEAPGADEDQGGKPFLGGAGRVLGRWFFEAGVFRREVYLDNVFSHRPPGNDLGSVSPNYFAAYEDLHRRIREVDPRVIIAFGEQALRFFGKAGISNWRGSCFEWNGIRVVPTIHPAAILHMRRPGGENRVSRLGPWRFCVADIRFAFRQAESHPTTQSIKYLIKPPASQFNAWCEAIPDGSEVSLDLETTMDFGVITQVNLSWRPREAIVVDLEESYVLPFLRVLGRPLRWVGQNIVMFDTLRISDLTGRPPIKVYADTMLAHHLVQSPAPHDLGFINSCYSRYPYYKDTMDSDRYQYAAKDADTTLQSWHGILRELKANGQWGPEPSVGEAPWKWGLFQTVMLAAHNVRAMHLRGVPVDKEILANEKEHLSDQSGQLMEKLKEATGNRWFNPRSWQDCRKFLYEQHKLPVQYNGRGKSRKPTTDDDALTKLAKLGGPGGEGAKLILAVRRPLNDLSKYFRPETVTPEGRWHPDWKIHGTETGRYSCWFHTLPPRVRHAIRKPGRRIAYVDAQQGEFRVAAWCSGDLRAKEVCEGEYGVHVDNATRIFSRIRGVVVKPDEVTAMMKFYAKFVTFGWLFGREAQSISEQYNIPLKPAQEILDGLNRTYPQIVIWKADTATAALANDFLVNPYTRRRYFPEGNDGDKEREAYNFIPQSTLHDIVQRAHIYVEWGLPADRGEVVADMHDALLLDVAPDFTKEEILPLIHREYLPGLTMPFDCEINDFWFDKRAEEDALGKVVIA
jgi:uracil-DNA glycosylase family 4